MSNLNEQLFIGEDIGSNAKKYSFCAMVILFFLFYFDVVPQVAEEINIHLKSWKDADIFYIYLRLHFTDWLY